MTTLIVGPFVVDFGREDQWRSVLVYYRVFLKVGGDTPRLAECVLRFILRGEDVGATPMRLSLKPPGDRLARRRRSLAGVLAQ